MKRIALIRDGLVCNICVWDGVASFDPAGFDKVDVSDLSEVCIGSTYDGSVFTQPAISPPEES